MGCSLPDFVHEMEDTPLIRGVIMIQSFLGILKNRTLIFMLYIMTDLLESSPIIGKNWSLSDMLPIHLSFTINNRTLSQFS